MCRPQCTNFITANSYEFKLEVQPVIVSPVLLVKDNTRIRHLWNHISKELWHCAPALSYSTAHLPGSEHWPFGHFYFLAAAIPAAYLIMVNSYSLFSAQNFHLHCFIWPNFPRFCYSCLNKLFLHLCMNFLSKFSSLWNVFSTPSPSAPRKPTKTSAANQL